MYGHVAALAAKVKEGVESVEGAEGYLFQVIIKDLAFLTIIKIVFDCFSTFRSLKHCQSQFWLKWELLQNPRTFL